MDERCRTNPLVVMPDGVRLYCGTPLIVDGVRIGALCLIDSVVRYDITRKRAMLLANFAELISATLARYRFQNQLVNLHQFPVCFLEKDAGGKELAQDVKELRQRRGSGGESENLQEE